MVDDAAFQEALKQGENIARAAATPTILYRRAGDPVVPASFTSYSGPVPFFYCTAEVKIKRLSVVAGQTIAADPTTTISFYAKHPGGGTAPVWSGSTGAWAGLASVELFNGQINLQKEDILVVEFVPGVGYVKLPDLLFVFELDVT